MIQLTTEESFLKNAVLEDMALYEIVKSAFIEALGTIGGCPGDRARDALWFRSSAFVNLKKVLSEP